MLTLNFKAMLYATDGIDGEEDLQKAMVGVASVWCVSSLPIRIQVLTASSSVRYEGNPCVMKARGTKAAFPQAGQPDARIDSIRFFPFTDATSTSWAWVNVSRNQLLMPVSLATNSVFLVLATVSRWEPSACPTLSNPEISSQIAWRLLLVVIGLMAWSSFLCVSFRINDFSASAYKCFTGLRQKYVCGLYIANVNCALD